MIGEVHQRYRILGKLGEGATGEVYLAEHLGLGRREALKILRPEVAAQAEFVHRFRREARATNRLQHPNIVSVHDFGQLPDGRSYLAIEYIEGARLDEEIARGRLPVARVVHILAQLADALRHAHDAGVLHRDLKPANVMLTERDHVKVLDFGLAKIIAPGHVDSVGLTGDGDAVGTPAYMAPELWTGEADVDGRADLYAIGCIAFEMLVGIPPFHGRLVEMMNQHLSARPEAPSSRVPGARIPGELDAIVARCLAKHPDDRFPHAGILGKALAQVPVARVESRAPRRSYLRMSSPPASDFAEEPPTHVDAARADPLAHTQYLDPEDLEGMYRHAVVRLADGLVAAGVHDVALVAQLARARARARSTTRSSTPICSSPR